MSILRILLVLHLFFFIQADPGIRCVTVTGVQTCALPIPAKDRPAAPCCSSSPESESSPTWRPSRRAEPARPRRSQIGRAQSKAKDKIHVYAERVYSQFVFSFMLYTHISVFMNDIARTCII